jgi:hypothetical protein
MRSYVASATNPRPDLAVASLPMKNPVEHIAQSLIVLHGADALKVAELRAENARKSGTTENLKMWLSVVAEIKRIQKS